MPTVSVIVPIYKVEPYLDACVESILRQTFSDFELILVDDGSPDRCGAMCDTWADKDPRIVAYHKANGGLSDARNYGIDRAKGEYLTFIDSDDTVTETYLEYLLSLFDLSADCRVTACNHYVVRGGRATRNRDFEGERILNRKEAFEETLYHGVLDVSACAKLYRRDVFETLRFPVGHLYEDTYVIGDVIMASCTIVCGSVPQYYYVQRNFSIVNATLKDSNFEFLDSVDRLCEQAMAFDPSFEQACIRRKSHAAFSVLRYMNHCEERYLSKRTELKQYILAHASKVLRDSRAPKRDKIAIVSLRFGLGVFYLTWKIYGWIR